MTEPDWAFGETVDIDESVYDDGDRPDGEPGPAHEDDGNNPGLDEIRHDFDDDDDDGGR